jgi:hypothetical protein
MCESRACEYDYNKKHREHFRKIYIEAKADKQTQHTADINAHKQAQGKTLIPITDLSNAGGKAHWPSPKSC